MIFNKDHDRPQMNSYATKVMHLAKNNFTFGIISKGPFIQCLILNNKKTTTVADMLLHWT